MCGYGSERGAYAPAKCLFSGVICCAGEEKGSYDAREATGGRRMRLYFAHARMGSAIRKIYNREKETHEKLLLLFLNTRDL